MTIEEDRDAPAGAGQAIAQTWEKLRPDEELESEGLDAGDDDIGAMAQDPFGDQGDAMDDEEIGLEDLAAEDDVERETTLQDNTQGL